MAAKFVLAFCVQAVFIQLAFSQCAPGLAPYGLAGPGLPGPGLAGPGLIAPGLTGPNLGPGLAGPHTGCGCGGLASSGGGFLVTSVSPLAPTGLSVVSENTIEGSLNIGGSLPFLGSVAVEGLLPTSGTGSVSYGCGNEGVGIVNESPIAGVVGSYPGPVGYGPLPAYGPGLIGSAGYNGLGGCGCSAVY